jgi:hypothetical protein
VTGPNLAFFLLILTSSGMVLVLLVGLVRQGIRLVKAGAEAADRILPIVDEIGQEADKAARHMDRLATAIAGMRSRG